MGSIIATSHLTRIALHRTELSFKKRGIVIFVVAAVEEDVLIVDGTLNDKVSIFGTSLSDQYCLCQSQWGSMF